MNYELIEILRLGTRASLILVLVVMFVIALIRVIISIGRFNLKRRKKR